MKIIYKNQFISGKEIVWTVFDMPFGKVLLAQTEQGICWLGINCGVVKLHEAFKGAKLVEDKKALVKTVKEIKTLWPNGLYKLSVPLVLYGTDFQLKVWREILKIKPGEARTYGELARAIENPKAVRAVGSAVGKNPLSIIVPCHRVTNRDAKKVNYGWGAEMKMALLGFENAF